MQWNSNLSADERLTRALVGGILILSAFIAWGKWIALGIGFASLLSARWGYCMTNELFKKMRSSSLFTTITKGGSNEQT